MVRNLFKRLQGDEGFTLIELLVVVAIIALLATFAVPRLFDAINKAKKAPGQADMQTISAALDRYYFDKNNYPVYDNTDAAADVMNALKSGYLKATTSFRNGFKQGYLYATSANGMGYVLVDMQGQKWDDDGTTDGDQVTMTCTGTSTTQVTWTLNEADDAVLVTPDNNTLIQDDEINNCVLDNATNRSKASLQTH